MRYEYDIWRYAGYFQLAYLNVFEKRKGIGRDFVKGCVRLAQKEGLIFCVFPDESLGTPLQELCDFYTACGLFRHSDGGFYTTKQ